jgi:transcriptional regulator GlxA family with amidase domain
VKGPVQVALFIFDGMTALDAVGPYEVLSRLPDVDVRTVSKTLGPKRSDLGSLAIEADALISDLPHPDIVLVSGGSRGVAESVRDPAILDWLRIAHETTTWTASVCTGALILGAAGILDGREATTHWRALDLLTNFDAIPRGGRFVRDGRVVTSGGVTAGIDMAFFLAEEIAGAPLADAIRLSMEYRLEETFGNADPREAPESVRRRVVDELKSAPRKGGD